MNSEASLWDVLRPLLQPYGRVDRVENALGEGMPDVNYCLRWRGNSAAQEGWVELKWANDTRLDARFLNQHKMSTGQINWHAHSGGRSHLITGRGACVFVHTAVYQASGCTLDLANYWTVKQAIEKAALYLDVKARNFPRDLLYVLTR